jgi:hypothetical protein
VIPLTVPVNVGDAKFAFKSNAAVVASVTVPVGRVTFVAPVVVKVRA